MTPEMLERVTFEVHGSFANEWARRDGLKYTARIISALTEDDLRLLLAERVADAAAHEWKAKP